MALNFMVSMINRASRIGFYWTNTHKEMSKSQNMRYGPTRDYYAKSHSKNKIQTIEKSLILITRGTARLPLFLLIYSAEEQRPLSS